MDEISDLINYLVTLDNIKVKSGIINNCFSYLIQFIPKEGACTTLITFSVDENGELFDPDRNMRYFCYKSDINFLNKKNRLAEDKA